MDWMEAPTGAMQRLHVGQKFHTSVSTTVETGRCCIHERRAITVSGNHRGMNTVLRIPRIFIAHTSQRHPGLNVRQRHRLDPINTKSPAQ
jgi:hypothetical protein